MEQSVSQLFSLEVLSNISQNILSCYLETNILEITLFRVISILRFQRQILIQLLVSTVFSKHTDNHTMWFSTYIYIYIYIYIYSKGCPENCTRGKLPPVQGQGLVQDQRWNQGWGAIFLGGKSIILKLENHGLNYG